MALHRRPAPRAAHRATGGRRPAALRARHRAGLRHGHRRLPRGAPGRRAQRRSRPRWCGPVPERRRSTCTVQLRAHGAEHRAVVRVDRRRRSTSTLLEPALRASRPARRWWSTTAPGSSARPRSPRPVVRLRPPGDGARATGIGSMPGEDFARDDPARARRAARPAAPARAPGSRRASPGMTGRTAGDRRRPRLRPAAGRLAADRRAGRRPPARALAAGAGPRHPRGAGPGVRRPAQGAGRRPVDAGRDDREAARRQGALRRRCPSRPRPGAGRRASSTTSPTCSGGCRAPRSCCRSTSPRCRP